MQSPDDPQASYQQRQSEHQRAQADCQTSLDRLGLARLVVFGGAVGLAWLAFARAAVHPLWLMLPGLGFVVLLVGYEQVEQARRRAIRAIRFYRDGLRRLDDTWPGYGHPGERFREEEHLFALDLDLFGTGSLFERLNTARTQQGEAVLAGWLRDVPPPVDEVLARQVAVQELTPQLDLREDLALLASALPPLDVDQLATWGESPATYTSLWTRWLLALAGMVNLSLLLVGLFTSFPLSPALITMAVTGLWTWRYRQLVEATIVPIESVSESLSLILGILSRLEREAFRSPRLLQLQQGLQVGGVTPSEQIRQLMRLVAWLQARKNQLFVVIAFVLFWRTQLTLALENWRARSGPAVRHWLETLAEFEALNALAAYAFENPEHPYPVLTTGSAFFQAQSLGHPLLPRKQVVGNDLTLDAQTRLLIVSGSNMSGKSTLLRSVGVNAVLAYAGAPVRAQSLTLTPLQLGATLRVQDSLLAGRSRFYAEIHRVRQILDRVESGFPILFLLDELFHGTNSHDRGVGAAGVLRQLLDAGAIGLITTHDLTLTRLAEDFQPRASNVHFADQFIEGQMTFDYRMRAGVVPQSNALALMRAIGLQV